MNEKLINLLESEKKLKEILNSLLYGSIEIRNTGNAKHVYVHRRIDGIKKSKYAGIFSDNLVAKIVDNNQQAENIKIQLKNIKKELKLHDYHNTELADKIKRNIDYANKHLPFSIYDQAVLEGISATYAETEELLEFGKTNNLASDDVRKIINLKRAWKFICDERVIQSPTNFSLLCEINKHVMDGFSYSAGSVRNVPVRISGTNYTPGLIIESEIKEEISRIINSPDSVLDIAINLALIVMKRQIFIDGNKRTAIIYANHLLIAHGLGLITVPSDLVPKFKSLLVNYYEDKDEENIKNFLINHCYQKI